MEALLHSPFGEVATLLVLAAVLGFAGLLLRQPLIVSFIAVGLVAGPSALDIVRSSDQIDLLSQLGIAVLLFLVGIKLDVKLIRSLGAVSLLTGLGQVAFTSVFGYLIGLGLGLGHVTSLYVAVALTFSSTIIIVKLLSDKREIDALHGQIALGFLIVQDLVVVLAMIVLSAIGIGSGEGGGDGTGNVLSVLGFGLAMVGAVVLFVRHVADPLSERLARAPELLVIFAIALAAIFAALADFVGLGMEVGGLLAGVALASTPYRETIAARLAPLRDFLLLFFFIALGAALDLSLLGAHVPGAILFSLFVLIGNPLIVLAIMGAMGYRKRTGFLAGLTVAQISEFSLIFVAMGVSLGHVAPEALGLVTMVGLVTIAASTYMITYSHRLYDLCEPVLGIFERRGTPREPEAGATSGAARAGVLIFGLGRFGTAIGMRLQKRGIDVLGVDFNPQAVRRARALGIEACYGDASDPEFLAELPLAEAAWMVSSVPILPGGLTQEDTRRTLIQLARGAGFRGRIAVASHNAADTQDLLGAGADLVLEPFQDAADRAVELLTGAPETERTAIPGIDSEAPQPA
ncbi:cation:proton antiporter [Rhodovulum sulfidophilum]|uniref:Cation:proton antiporter n=2 Tax=Rhodovulum sulfidophilum TaxID=35806 RepID=A0ABS1RSA8_RHOSU|nr:cation:proton antiporter [Rhodovulum sulfidophilum]MBL3551851.1 cation:proton antiporter [Rhodovulum sulfidophilum]MBL3595817.1 cation:proton antiporter [Rhodovulum sulfidophilum]MBL3608437.1 cation:proton antiporter [Rhodovulum sulfidophilum]MCE8457609.1 cation:proton antiporter [Rhodovulum sulfidophilum]